MTSPTIYGFPSMEWNLPDDMAYVSEAVEAWRGWRFLGWGFHTSTLKKTMLGVHTAIKLELTYEPDTEQADRWQHPESLLCGPSIKYLHGDCEDFALCFAGLAHRALGIDPADIFVTVLHLPKEDIYYKHHPALVRTPAIHAVCVIRTPEGNKVLDQRAIEVMDDTPDPDIRPIFSIALSGESFLHGEK